MISGAQLRAARALLDMDRKALAELSGVSLPTIQRMESANGVVGGTVDTLMKVVEALEQAITRVRPYAVDVSGGVERDKGIKDESRIEAFMRGVRRADQ